MKTTQLSIGILSVFTLLAVKPISSEAASLTCKLVFEVAVKREAWSKLSLEEKNKQREALMMTPAKKGEIERRPFYTTTGERKDAVIPPDPADKKLDTADPSLVMPITYPNGVTKYRKNFSGGFYVEANTPQELFMAGPKKIHRSRMFYKNGVEMVGAYHIDAFPWDVVIYRNDQGELIALGGVMELMDGKLPTVAENNPTRSRWWGKVEHHETSPGVFEERIIWQEPVHDFNRAKHKGWNQHGYGGTLVTEFNPDTGVHEPIKNKRGNYILMYERVTEEKSGKPWLTTTFMREMLPSLKSTVGPEFVVTNLISPKTGKLFEALRRGPINRTVGYLREGDNVFKYIEGNQFIKTGSANDYVRNYGIYIDYRDPGDGPIGMYKNVLDDRGQLVDFAERLKLREIFNGTWVGRPQTGYDPLQQIWLSGHTVRISTIPKGEPVVGYPSKKGFPYFGRNTWEFPVKIVHDEKGQPHFVSDIDFQWAYMFEE